jgi:hypothetical protein
MYVTDEDVNYYSGPASRNPDGFMHALVDDMRIVDELFVGFEDLPGNQADNYADLEFSLSNATFEAPVPIPAALALFAPAVAALGWSRRRR